MTRFLPAVIVMLSLVTVPARADVVRLLEGDRDGMQARVDVIQQAKKEVNAVYFLAYDDRITQTALGLLRDASRRGVKVRVVVDANFQHIPRSVLAHLHDEKVEVRVYHPFTFRKLGWLFHRMHDKVVIVDGKSYITGGRNLAESYFGLKKRNYIDRDVYVEGASAEDAQKYFEELWASNDVRDLDDVRVSPAEKAKAAQILDEAALGKKLEGFVTLNTGRDWSEGLHDAGPVRFLHDPIGFAKGVRLAVRLGEAIDGAKSSVIIESPYLVPSPEVLELLRRKSAEGVNVQIVTNSLRACDGVLPYVAYIKYRRGLLRAGVDMREFRGPDTLHSKTLVIDGRIVLVGSYNIDQRSENLNTEVMAEVDDEAVAKELLAAIGHHIDNSWAVGSNARGPHAPRAWRVRAWMARLLLIPFVEKQL
ncbi:MAG: cardiolipin synthase [Thermoanaerobaculia bacterium]|jgi:phosphatidylserine/phosphatidylglycerophosphate/cardiolipin synthase-like enzyme|nr:cardiolipin synthase [Thermoanaerobaculia bacterium]